MEREEICVLLKQAEAFTKAHQMGGSLGERELRCLRAQFPAIFRPIGEEDLFAGYTLDPIVSYRYSWSGERGHLGYCRDYHRMEELLQDESLSKEERELAEELEAYWKEHSTRAAWDRRVPERDAYYYEGLAEVYPRLAEINLDFDKLLRLGIPGLRKEVLEQQERHPQPIYDSLLGVLDLLAEMLCFLAQEARAQIPNAEEKRQKELVRMAETMEDLSCHAPGSFYGALCLFHLVVMMTTVDNFARMDVYMGDFLVQDLKKGVLTYEEALEMFVNLYRRYDRLFSTTGRIIIGGEGRRNVENADQMALLILDAAKVVHGEAPTLCLRVYSGMNPALWEKAMDDLEAGCSYPLLYNDEINIPNRMKAMRVSREEAQQYIMSNCGEYGLWARSIHSPNGAINYAKVLELALNNGLDPMTGTQKGPKTGDAAGFTGFEELLEAFKAQAAYFIRLNADQLLSIYEVAAEESYNLLMTLLYEDCVSKGQGLLKGARYRFYDIETHAIVLVADSLLAVKQVVFEEKKMTMEELLDALKHNFEGYEIQRTWLMHAPKFGNNDSVADEMTRMISDFVQMETAAQADRLGVHAFTASQITVDNYEVMGRYVGATPDGRLALTPVTNSINPANGCDKEGVIALLHSMAGVDSSLSGGMVHHLKLSPSAFGPKRRAATSAMIRTFFAEGGGELSVYTVNQQDLIDAVEHPEKHQDLIVRIGGFNARFVNLSPVLQKEMIARNAYTG